MKHYVGLDVSQKKLQSVSWMRPAGWFSRAKPNQIQGLWQRFWPNGRHTLNASASRRVPCPVGCGTSLSLLACQSFALTPATLMPPSLFE
mgnify:CR=1 FL=1